MATKVKLQRGLVGIRPYIPGRSIEEVKRTYGVSQVIKLASNENTLGTSPLVMAALARLSNLNYYPDPLALDLAAAIARLHQLTPEWIIVGNGADAILAAISRAYIEDGDEGILGAVSFPTYQISVEAMRGRTIPVAMHNHGLDLAAMAQAIGPRSKVIYVCNPNNPTGTCVSQEEVAYLMERVPDEVLVVFDQAYYEYAQGPDYADGMEYLRQGRENVIVLRTFSKVYGMAGLRLGYGVAHPSIVACLREAGERFPVNQAAQVAGMAALQDDEWLRQTVALVRSERAWIATQLEEMGLEYIPSQANFMLIRLGSSCQRVIEALLGKGVIVRPGAGFGMPEWLRLTIGRHDENQCFIDALKQSLQP